ncbi:heparan-sulfate 6-O-sulfotransferase 2-like [Anguilla rostrata]|uniref:heparan-sulfate 6-O-sulfotransferase 2-like n=1 Tax=Anguilla rostrata TaxID=7938 RepID=UPI0030D5CD36
MDEKSNNSRLLLALLIALLFGIIVLQYACPGTDCKLQLRLSSLSKLGETTSGTRSGSSKGEVSGRDPYISEDGTLARFVPRFNFTTNDLRRTVDFDIKGDDVIVFLHIQKTGGTTFGRHLVRNIQLERPCECPAGQKKCTCYRPGKRETWLFSRFSTGWSCGLHADWTELTRCVPSRMGTAEHNKTQKVPRTYHYISILRDPVWRYLSEWRHVQRGATWKAARHVCDGRSPTPAELPACYPGDDWSGCSLEAFMDCPHNLANNRQTRMLADLSLVGCYNLSATSERERGAALLESAKRNLRGLAFFGLTEFQRGTQYLFERAFRLRFVRPFAQLGGTRVAGAGAGPEARRRILELNRWDAELYEYARDLFLQRYRLARQRERGRARRRRRRHESRRTRGGEQRRARPQRPPRPEPHPPPAPVQWEEGWGEGEEGQRQGPFRDYLENVERWR